MTVSPRFQDVVRPGHTAAADDGEPDIHDIIDRRLVRTVFQPLHDLDDGALVAMEALSRGPAGSRWESPLALLAAATGEGRLAALDEMARAVAIDTAWAAGWPPGLSLFVNAECSTLSDQSMAAVTDAAGRGIRVTVELTERDVVHDVAMLLRATERLRAQGARVALDDVGAHPASLTLIPLLRPDVVKLDMALVRDYTAGAVAEVANAVRAYAEESGASVVAEGLETTADVEIARVLGANVGQGWLLGRPGPFPPVLPPVRELPSARVGRASTDWETPYDVVAAQRAVSVSTKALLLPLSLTLEQRGLAMPLPPLLLSCFQHERHFTIRTRERYRPLVDRLPFVCALGDGMPVTPIPGLRGAQLSPQDPLAGEWTVIVLGAHFAAALVARDLGDTGPDRERRFRYVLTHDRSLVVAAARTLISRVAPS